MTAPSWWEDVVARMRAHQRERAAVLPGMVFAAETVADGPLIAGVGDGWTRDTICNIGSMTKTFTATAVLLALEEHAALDVDLPVCEFPGMDAYRADPRKRRIRVRDLLEHTSGLPVFVQYTDAPSAPCNDPQGPPPACECCTRAVGPTVGWLGSPGYTNECVLSRGRCRPARSVPLEDVGEYLMRHYPLVHDPGTEYSYSSANYVIAGLLVERLTETSPNLYLKRRLFDPLGMRDSFFVPTSLGDPAVDARIGEGVDDEQRARIADVALITRDGRWPVEVAPGPDGIWDRLRRGWRYVYPDAGMFATAADLLAYLRLLRDGGLHEEHRVVSDAVARLLTEDQGRGHTMAMGFRRTATPYGQGPGTLEHLGNIMTYFWLDPRAGDPVLGVFLSQRLANALVDNNMSEGLRDIFRAYVPLVSRASQRQAAISV